MKRLKLTVTAGPRSVSFCPVSAVLELSPDELEKCCLTDVARQMAVPFQTERSSKGTVIHWMLDCLAAGQSRTYELGPGPAVTAEGGVRICPEGAGSLAVHVGSELLSRYIFGDAVPRPCLYPLIGPFGQGVTRAYPQERVEGDSTDHIHHRSLYVAWGDVNGSDNWSEQPGAGRIAHRGFDLVTGGPVFGAIVSRNDWLDSAGRKLMEDSLEIRFYNTPPAFRLLDLAVTFRATEGNVRFGDTKEGGIISLRVATSMEARRGGRIENSVGGVNEAETWGKRAAWCDYCGPVGGRTVGIAVFDHPSNFRYPTYWHVRDYGLMTANPFGLSFFVGKEADGSHMLAGGQQMCFRYRILVHAGTACEGQVREKCLDWHFPPCVTVQQ